MPTKILLLGVLAIVLVLIVAIYDAAKVESCVNLLTQLQLSVCFDVGALGDHHCPALRIRFLQSDRRVVGPVGACYELFQGRRLWLCTVPRFRSLVRRRISLRRATARPMRFHHRRLLPVV